MFRLLKTTVSDLIEDDCPTMAAALAYYTVLSLPPLLMLVIALAGFFVGREQVQGAIRQQFTQMMGQGAAEQAGTMVARTQLISGQGWWSALLGVAVLIFGATTAFAQLQTALNRAWEIQVDPGQGGVKTFLGKRILSFGMILALAFLSLVSLVLSAALAAAGSWAGRFLPEWMSGAMLQGINAGAAIAIIAALFGAIFMYLPDAKLGWRQVAVGAVLTALLFSAGKFLIAYYLGSSGVAGACGAAGSLILILVWVYYSSMIVLFGAEFTQAWAKAHGTAVEPEEGALRIAEETPRQPKRAA
ncbi:MAG: YihY/virulence factor BrkB family protein [Bryobacterales bacterium]|nr:YihY/virulence factor BrkB family protein [Bryobacterales bacterium]